MGRNIVIFSDGTGQRGGITFDERRSNIYKLYRATRCGPDSGVSPVEQVAYYDPGIGTVPGGHSDMIEDGQSGLLVPSGDLAALRGAMERLIDDAELRTRLGHGAANRAALFSAEAVIPQFDVLYARVQRRGEMA